LRTDHDSIPNVKNTRLPPATGFVYAAVRDDAISEDRVARAGATRFADARGLRLACSGARTSKTGT
jgi:hypothetical protein